jgi:hypothetical protein
MAVKDIDFFNREGFSNGILQLIQSLPSTPFVIGIDAPWGEGKTTFINDILLPKADESTYQKLKFIKYDSFEHERDGDPFASIVATLISNVKNQLKEVEPTDQLIEKVAEKASSILLGGLKVVGNAAARHILKESVDAALQRAGFGENASNLSDKVVDDTSELLKQKLLNYKDEIRIKEAFKKAVSELIETLKLEKLVIVIDELDRCRPSHALDVFESLLHLLDVDNLVFIVTYHKAQLCEMVKHAYGSGVNAELYLHKFINVDWALPSTRADNYAIRYESALTSICQEFRLSTRITAEVIEAKELIQHLNRVFGGNQRTNKKIILIYLQLSSTGIGFNDDAAWIMIFWKVFYPEMLQQLSDSGDTVPIDSDVCWLNAKLDDSLKPFGNNAVNVCNWLKSPERNYAIARKSFVKKLLHLL